MSNTQRRMLAETEHVDAELMRRDGEADAAAAAAPSRLSIQVHQSLAGAEATWRLLETVAVMTPNQRYDWLLPLREARDDKEALAIAVLLDAGRPVALLPLWLQRRLGLTIARLLGDRIGNSGWLPFDPADRHRLDAATLRWAIDAIAAAVGGIDVLALHCLPATWQDHPNPLLALPHQPAPDPFYSARIDPDRPNSKRRRNILRGRRRLEETMGPVVLRRATSPEEIDRIHAVFLAQREARVTSAGIPNVFAAPWFVAFFRAVARQGLGQLRPALRFHALYAGDEIVATSIGSYAGRHYSQFINSTAEGEAAKASLMGLLLYELLTELQAEGIETLDMGLGEFAYKTDWTDSTAVYDVILPLTARGRIAAPLLRARRTLKGAVKRNPRLFGLYKRLRILAARRPGHG